MSERNANVGVIGCGYWGRNLVRNLYELGNLKTVCDTDKQVLRGISRKYPGVQPLGEVDVLLSDPEIDAIVVATPAVTHYELAKRAIASDKHVFVEKPLAVNLEEAQHLVDMASAGNKALMVGHILQYHPAVTKLKELIDRGELGKIQYLYSNRLNIGKIRAEENILWSFAPHDISVILMLLGEMPETVYATGGSYLQNHIPDTTLTTMDFPSGVKAHIFVSWLHPFKEQKLVVVGDRKMAVFDDVSEEKLQLYPHTINWLRRIPVAAKAEAESVHIDMQEPLKAECLHFLECISNGSTPKTDGEEGLRVLEVLQASQESLNQNGCKVKLDQTSKRASDTRNSHSQESTIRRDLRVNGYFAHESSYVDNNVEIGAGTKIWHFSHVLGGSQIGRNCNIGQNVVIGPDVTIGNTCKIQNNVSIYKGVTLEDEVFCGPSMVFTNVYNPRSAIRRMDEIRPTSVKKGASIGANATVICGITIGRYAFIGAGAVVNRDVKDYALVVGNPARQIGWMCECGVRLNEGLDCSECGKQYAPRADEPEAIAPLDEKEAHLVDAAEASI